jgi:hypothetical protein
MTGSVLQIYPFDFKPSAPPSGAYLIYAKTDNNLYLQTSAGVEISLGSSSAITTLAGEASGSGTGTITVTLDNNAVIGKVLTGFVPGPSSPIEASDTILEALQKVQSQIDSIISVSVPDATPTVKGKLKLAGDLGGSADSPTVPGLANKENLSNKSTDTALGSSDTLYPTQNAVKSYVDTAVSAATIPDATGTIKGKLKLAGDLGGTADSPTVPGLANKLDIPTGSSSDYIDGTGAVQPFPEVVSQSQFDEYNLLQKEPTGFPNRTDSVTSFNNSTREFTISPAGASFEVYVKGKKYVKTTPQTTVISSSSGNHYIYFDVNGSLQSSLVIDASTFQDNAFVGIIYWNNEISQQVYYAEERHGLVMDGATHGYLHTIFGARYLSGLALQGFSVDGTGNLAANAQFNSDSGSIRDEDLVIQIPAEIQIAILYRQGTLWRKKTADSYPVIYSGTAGYVGLNGRLPYNLLSGGSWTLEEVPNNNFVLVHFFATNDVNSPVIGIQGISTYGSISSARTGAKEEISTLSGLPFAEFVAIGSVIFQTSTGYTNIPKAIVRSADTGVNYVDFRGTQAYAPASFTATSHSILSNLSADDHPQYLNQDRGDARYYTKTQTDSLLAGKYDVSNPAGYVNATEAANAAPVQSVNGEVGDVIIDASDIGLIGANGGLQIPTQTTAQRESAILDEGEIVYDYELDRFYGGDGISFGGMQLNLEVVITESGFSLTTENSQTLEV